MTTLGATQNTVEMPAIVRVSSQFDKTADATPANITGLSVDLTAGRTYIFEAHIYMTADATGGINLSIGGTATATNLRAVGQTFDLDSAAGTIRDIRQGIAITSTMADIFGYATFYTRITGTITVNAAGTLTLRFSQQSSSGTSSVLVGSSLRVTPVT